MTSRYKKLLLPLLIVFVSLGGCVNDDTSNCRRGLIISFYSQTPCQQAPSYPTAIHGLDIYIFDSDGILAASRNVGDVVLTADYTQEFFLEDGDYTVAVWSGAGPDAFEITDAVTGVTRIEDVFSRIRRSAQTAASLQGVRVYSGISSMVSVGAAGTDQFQSAAVNLLEKTNRIAVTVLGLIDQPELYEVFVEAGNGSAYYNGELAPDEILTFEPVAGEQGQGLVNRNFTLLELDPAMDYNLVLRDLYDGATIFNGDLLATLILKNPTVNLACDHDFSIVFTAAELGQSGTYVITEITVNGWVVHSYETDFRN